MIKKQIRKAKMNTASRVVASIVGMHIRKAQSIEVFRSAFRDAASARETVALSDLDYLIKENKIRPSILVNAFELCGKTLGILSNSLLTSRVKNGLIGAVDDACTLHFNDSIRELSGKSHSDSTLALEVKDALKYHRDCISVDNPDDKGWELVTKGLYKVMEITKTI